MTIISPAWLWLLVPWAGLVVLVLRAYRPKVAVSFLQLWPRERPADERRRSWHPPELPITLLLVAAFIGIVALAQPVVQNRARHIASACIVVDRGITMLVGNRLKQATDAACSALKPLTDAQSSIRVLDTQGQDKVVGPDSLASALKGDATCQDTRAVMHALAERALAESSGPVLIISDCRLDIPAPRIVPVSPSGLVDNVGIVSASLSGNDCTVRLRNNSPRTQISIVVEQGGEAETYTASLAPRGQISTMVVGPIGHELAKISIPLDDDLADDNTVWVWPASGAARIATRGALPQAVAQFALSYAKARPAAPPAPVVTIASEPSSEPRQIIVAPLADVLTVPEFTVLPDHPVLCNAVLPRRVIASPGPLPPGNWKEIVSVNGKPLLAVDDEDRRIWLGFAPASDLVDDASAADYLVLLTNCVEYCTTGAITIAGPAPLPETWRRIDPKEPVSKGELGLRAGLYQNADRYSGINVASPELNEYEGATDAGAVLAHFADTESQVPLTPWLWVATAVLIAGSAATGRLAR